jgi:CheY-like chemotaxis protein
MPSSIFVVDSSPAVLRMVEQISTPEGFDVVGFQDGPAALTAAKQGNPSLIIVDYQLDNMTFSGFCKEINKLDNLAETFLVTLISQADQLDEHLFRTLGVKAFLKKPFQADELLGIIRHHKQQQQQLGSAPKLKRRAWPPTTGADSDEEERAPQVAAPALIFSPGPSLSDALSAALSTSPSPIAKPAEPAIARPSMPPSVAPVMCAASPEIEDPMKGIFDQLLQSMTNQIEKRLADVLPQVIEEALAIQVRPVVQKEMRAQLGDILSEEHLGAIMRPLLSRELPSLLGKEIANYEPIIRQTVSDLIGTLVKAKLDIWVRDQAETGVRRHLPEVIREHIGSVDQIVRDEVRVAAQKQMPPISDETIRATSERAIDQAVQRIVPELAEQHITAELKRLTASS